ncbi:ATP-binding protein [soil metagenome]
MIWSWKSSAGRAEAKSAAREATAPEGAIAAFAAALPDPVLLLDQAGMVTLANTQAQALFDFDPTGQHVSTAIRAPGILGAVAQVLAGGEALRADHEMHGVPARHFEAYITAMPESEHAVLILLRDLTREQRIERMRADFVAHASHELRTPLASLLGFVETLQGAARKDEASRDRFLALMKTQAERMKRLIDDLLSLSRIEMNAHQRPSETVDLTMVARHVADTLSGLAKDAGVELKITLEPVMPVRGDWDELVQVVQNLIENAIKYAASGKIIKIDGHRVDGVWELTVRDFGPGIADEHIPRLTERFYRINAQESRARGGTGLGLAIVKHILNRHRGRLKVTSRLGDGTCFTIRVPASDAE